MTLGALSLLNMGGGQADPQFDANTLYVGFEDTNLIVFRGLYDMKVIYIDVDAKKRIQADWTDWLNGSTIDTSTWTVESSSTEIVVSDTSNTTAVTVAYINAAAGTYQLDINLKNTIVTNDAIPETESRSFLIKVVRTR